MREGVSRSYDVAGLAGLVARRLTRRQRAVLRARGADVTENLLSAVCDGAEQGEQAIARTALKLGLAAEMLRAGIAYPYVKACMREPMPTELLEVRLHWWATYRAPREAGAPRRRVGAVCRRWVRRLAGPNWTAPGGESGQLCRSRAKERSL